MQNIVKMLVGGEGSCDFPSVQAAVEAAERLPSEQHVQIFILSGVYREAVKIYRSRLSLIGIGQVEITMNHCAKDKGSDGKEIGTFATPTLFVGGNDVHFDNLIISNTAGQGEEVGQALAVYAHSDRTVFKYCTIRGHQDTLFTGPLPPSPKAGGTFGGVPLKERHARYRQLYYRCRVEGTVDFIFGGATAYFEQCEIHSLPPAKKGLPGFITAASTPFGQSNGFIFRDCCLTASPGIEPNSVYLGRPWREYAKTVFVNCRMGRHIQPAGWDNWGNTANEATVTYAEFGSISAAENCGRVSWAVCEANGGEELSKEQVLTTESENKERWWETYGTFENRDSESDSERF